MKKIAKKGFTLVEIMFVISIIGVLAAIGIPSILHAYSAAQEKTMQRNVAAVEKAKGVLTLPPATGMSGAMGLGPNDPFDEEAVSNLCSALNISDISELSVGKNPITIGDLANRAYYGYASVSESR